MTLSGQRPRESHTDYSSSSDQKTSVETLQSVPEVCSDSVFMDSGTACYSATGMTIEYQVSGSEEPETHSVRICSDLGPNQRVHFSGVNAAVHARDVIKSALSSHRTSVV